MKYEDIQKLVISNNYDYVCVTYISASHSYYGRLVRVYCSGDNMSCYLVIEDNEKFDMHLDSNYIINIEFIDCDLGL